MIVLLAYLIGCVVYTLVAFTIYLTNRRRETNHDTSREMMGLEMAMIALTSMFWPLVVVVGLLALIAWRLSGGLDVWLDDRELRVKALKQQLAAKEIELAEARAEVDSWTR